ncbi:MAG TPA: Nif11-like leader peptide family RiPP precursor [Candidatus Babeliales bacterium]|nr:Nif11-like leader peptide family RiPP precursor [Candidatus Babeliales bacterium]
MSQALNDFFTVVATDKTLQERLFVTKEVSDVATIANEMGFSVTGADVLRAQVGRVLTLPSEELENLVAGNKSKKGAQWGRAGKGWLDNAGFWILELIQWGCTVQSFEPSLDLFVGKAKEDKELQQKLLAAKTYESVANIAHEYGYEVASIDLLKHMAIQIMKLNDEKAETVASGGAH